MKKTAVLLILLISSACVRTQGFLDRRLNGENPYVEAPFYARYLGPDSLLDRQITQQLAALKENPRSAVAHNDLGSLLTLKGFPKDAKLEFVRAINADPEFHPAWYNLALIREASGDFAGAMSALGKTLDLKPGHPAAHFQLGLLLEKRGRDDAAVEHYARAIKINHAMLDPRVNPRVVDTKLLDRALLLNYPVEHARRAIRFQSTPAGYVQPDTAQKPPEETPTSVSPQAPAEDIVTPSAPVTDPATQTPPPNNPPRRRANPQTPDPTPPNPPNPQQGAPESEP